MIASSGPHTPPCLAERYAHAATTSHLKVEEGRCAADYLIAAGWLRLRLGVLLYRLRGEFDAMRARLRAVEAQLPGWEHRALGAEGRVAAVRRAWAHPGALPWALVAEPARIRAEGRAYVAAEHAAVMASLKTLRPATAALQAFAVGLNERRRKGKPLPSATAAALASRALWVWLDPICAACQGRGFNGGAHRGERCIKCGGCHGSGQRRATLGETAEERWFAHLLLDEVAEHLKAVGVGMRRRLRQGA